ncbi:Ig-like domain-containing protein [Sediminispirochaeta smaragdinae]|uniref:SbsA Ig-like domain-containing protein n=1 Tax=Sediminispirochaeta smaragdinae (strain DSM 11293 / JCM 15392 / SEBR 4228) TaxID=573413 RepID=E1R166_SEDSS|nr:Ig-like domain-containing protein [Sediminispirochaeta smaragdinae]ADK80886.1 hypothetical protein Spirs_1760 [Sediminispirochaeta smaragdinae DSM 11293]
MKAISFPVPAIIIAVLVPLLIPGCHMIDDYLHMDAPEVRSITPAEGYADPSDVQGISIWFSASMDRPKTEAACIFSQDDQQLEGSFSWASDRLIFTPYLGITSNHVYTVTVTTEAEDDYGNSLLHEVNHQFFTGEEIDPPFVTGTSPQAGDLVSDPYAAILIEFSEGIDEISFIDNFSISPEVMGTISWSPDKRSATFTPLVPYERGEEYEVQISKGVRDLAGNQMTKETFFRFTAGDKGTYEISSVEDISGGFFLHDIADTAYTTGIEKADELLVTFSAAVPEDEKRDIITVNPSISYDDTWNSDNTTLHIIFDEELEYGKLYELNIVDSTYRFLVDGPHSLPLSLSRIIFINDTASPVPVELHLNDILTISDSDRARFDVYLHHAQGAVVDTSSFMDAFSLSSSAFQSLDFTSYSIDVGATESVVHVDASIEMASGISSICTIRIEASLCDSYDNYLEDDYLLTLQVLPP